ncbi:MAG: hypothetical protein ACREPV_01335 [Lysobacter sp.]
MRIDPLPAGWGLRPGAMEIPDPTYHTNEEGQLRTARGPHTRRTNGRANKNQRDRVFALIEADPTISAADIIARTGYPESTVYHYRCEAREEGLLP